MPIDVSALLRGCATVSVLLLVAPWPAVADEPGSEAHSLIAGSATATTESTLSTGLSVAPASTDPDPLQRGIAAYRRGDFVAARNAFESALPAAPDDPVIVFNLALTQYRLGDYASARTGFARLRSEPDMRGIADYHLGLIAAQTGDLPAARTLLSSVAAAPDRVGDLARAALARIASEDAPRRIRAYVMAGLGYDSNRTRVARSVEISGRDPEAAYSDLVAEALAPMPWRGEYDLRATLFRRDYATDDALDQSSLQLALRRTWRPAEWRLAAALESESILLRDMSLVQSTGLGLEAEHRFGPGTLRLRYQPAQVQAEGDFDYLDGRRQRAMLAHDSVFAGMSVRAGWEYEQSGQADDLEADIVYGQAPHRHGPFLRLSRPLRPGLLATARAGLRNSRYDSDKGLTTDREDDLLQLGLALRLSVPGNVTLLVEYRYQDNQSNVPDYDYDRTTVLAGLEWRR